MGLLRLPPRLNRRKRGVSRSVSARLRPDSWIDRTLASLRTEGRMGYRVYGYYEVSDALRRGHNVLLAAKPGVDAGEAPERASCAVSRVERLNPSTGRFVVSDLAGGAPYELTPKRLDAFLEQLSTPALAVSG